MTLLKTLSLSCLAAAVAAQSAWACAFHGYTPRPTLIDLLYASEQVILARPDASNQSRFEPVEALAGSLDLVDLPQSADKAVRARLAAAPDATVLYARDGSYGPWVQHAVVGPAFRDVIDTALAQQSNWQGGTGTDRAKFFARHVTNPDPAVRTLALLELDRVDYRTLRRLRIKGLGAQAAALESGDAKLRPIRILLAGLSRDSKMAEVLTSGIDRAVAGNRRYLGAYTTALIELEGANAATGLAAKYLANEAVDAVTKELIIEAFAIQNLYGSRAVKRRIEKELASVLAAAPNLAGAVARQFSRHNNWRMAGAVDQARKAAPPRSAKDAVPITKYLAYTDQATR